MSKAFLQFVVAGVLVSTAMSARAQHFATLQASEPGTHYIGFYLTGPNALGGPGMVTVTPSGACKNIVLLTDGRKLQRNVEYKGSQAGANTMVMVTSNVNICGRTVEPIDTNGFIARLTGGPFDDVIFNGGIPNVLITGGQGNDTLVSLMPVFTSMRGEDGQDYLYGNNQSAGYGGAGDDTFCAAPGSLFGSANGDAGWDTLCGAGAIAAFGIEATGCGCSLF